MTSQEMEVKVKDLLGQKITSGEMDFLHGFYRIPNIYHYSIRNQILIAIQGGSIALGFDRWTKLNRHVKRGEKAKIEILMPIMKTYKEKDNGELDEKCVGFIGRKVFDITQTDGEPLQYQNNSAEVIDYQFNVLAPKLAESLSIKIDNEITGSARGYYNRLKKEIMVSSMSNNSDKIKTMMHELGHYLLHESAEEVQDHPAREVEAELTSLLVCSVLGVEFAESSLYIKAYNEHKPEVRVLKVISAVQKILKAII